MEDETSGHSPPMPEPRTEEAGNPDEGGLGPSLALLRAVFGNRVPSGPLGHETVPIAVLDLPIEVATAELEKHFRKCNKLNCPQVPQPLWVYKRMRPSAIRKGKNLVHKVLWTQPDHELVATVRKQILKKHEELARQISSGDLLRNDCLQEALNGLGGDGPRILTAVLWAAEFAGPGAESLFRALVPLATDGSARVVGTVPGIDDRTSAIKADLRKTKKGRKNAVRIADRAQRELEAINKALDDSKRESEAIRGKYGAATEELQRARDHLHELQTTSQRLERNVQIATKQAEELRRDLRTSRKGYADLDLGRSDLVRQLAEERRRIENLKLRLAAIPTGKDAVRDFLRAEEDRIDTDRTIHSGGAKLRADAEWAAHRKLEKAFFDAYPEYRQPPPVNLRLRNTLRLVTLGGSSEVGRSCYLLELGKHRILVDCGIKPGDSGDLLPALDRLERVDALLLTHAHTDHVGWVPALIRKFPNLDIYCSEGTAALLPIILDDCHQHYSRRMAKRREQAQYIGNAGAVEDEYDRDDVNEVSKHVIKCAFDVAEPLPFGDASVHFYHAGHILGAASILIQDSSGRRVFFSGDFSSFDQLTVAAAAWQPEIGEVDLLVLESTYGGRTHRPLKENRAELISFLNGRIADNGSVILASFGLGRAQELLKLIASARENGELPAVPVYVDGMIRRINPIYRKHADFNLMQGSFTEVSGESDRQLIAFTAKTRPSIIVTTSGMLTGGPVIHYARSLLPDPRHRIVLTGYQDEGAPSKFLRQVVDGRREVRVEDESGELVVFEVAMPAKEVQLSSHADHPGLLEYARLLRPKHIALVHGESVAQERLCDALRQVHPGAVIECGPAELSIP